jgi:hypothetical protein
MFFGLLFAAIASFIVCWTTQPLFWTTPRPVPPIAPNELRRDVRWLVETFPGREARRPDVLAHAADELAAKLRTSGGRVWFQPYNVGGQTYINVRAQFGPAEGALVVVGAHYDVYDGLPGADDNASGVAALLAVGRRLGETPPKSPVELVVYTLEEPPHFGESTMGSAEHVRALLTERREVSAMLCLEMLGAFSDEHASQQYPIPGAEWFLPDRGNFIMLVGKLTEPLLTRRVKRAMQSASTLPVRSVNVPEVVTGVDWSDHRNYWAAAIPAIMITDTSFLRYPQYHTLADTPDRLDYVRMANVVEGVWSAVEELTR